jgi:hypothetical protein
MMKMMKRRTETITADAYQRMLAEQARQRKPQGHPEHDLQVACVAWFRSQYPDDAAMLFAVPNGGKRRKVEAALMKAEGVLPGVADLILLEARGGYGALCIEMKTRRRGSGQSEKQEEWQAEAERHGNKYAVARDQAEFCRIVAAYMRQERTCRPAVVSVTAEEINAAEMAGNRLNSRF